MSEIKVDTLSTVSGSGNLTVSNNIAGTSATLSATLGVTGNTTVGGTLVNTGLYFKLITMLSILIPGLKYILYKFCTQIIED